MIALLQHFHGLHSERYSDKLPCLRFRDPDAQLQLTRPFDHFLKKVVDRVEVYSGALSDGSAYVAPHFSQELSRRRAPPVIRFAGEDTVEAGVVGCGSIYGVVSTFSRVMLGQRCLQSIEWFDFAASDLRWTLSGNIGHQPIHIFQFA